MKIPFRKQSASSRPNPEEEDIARVYCLFRDTFIRYYQTHSVDLSILEDICQDSFLILHRAIQNDAIPEGTLLIKYLFGIGRKKLYKYWYQQGIQPLAFMEEVPEYMNTDDSIEWNEEQKIVREVIRNMGKECKEILSLFILEEKKWDEVMTIMRFNSYNDAKNRKSRCHKKLLDKARDVLRKEGLI